MSKTIRILLILMAITIMSISYIQHGEAQESSNLEPIFTTDRILASFRFAIPLDVYGGTNQLLFDKTTGKLIETNDVEIAKLPNALFTPDGKSLISTNSHYISRWDIASGNQVYSIERKSGGVKLILISPDGKFLVMMGRNSAAIFDAESGDLLHELDTQASVSSIAIDPNSKLVAVGGEDPPILLFDIETGEKIKQLDDPKIASNYIRFSANGEILYSWHFSRSLDARGVRTFYMEQWRVSTGRIYSVWDKTFYRGFTANDVYAWTGGVRFLEPINGNANIRNRREIVLHSPQSGAKQQSLSQGFDWLIDSVRFITFSPDDQTALVGIEAYVGAEVKHRNPRSSLNLALDPQGGVAEQHLVYVDITSGRILNQYEDNELIQTVSNAVFSKDNHTVLSTTTDNTVVLWDARTGELIQQIGNGKHSMDNLGFNADESYALTVDSFGRAEVWLVSNSD